MLVVAAVPLVAAAVVLPVAVCVVRNLAKVLCFWLPHEDDAVRGALREIDRLERQETEEL